RATRALRRVWQRSPLFNAGDVGGRPPDGTRLAEHRLANVVDEMALAAGIPVPRIVILRGGANAAACGRDRDHVTILVGESTLEAIPREQLQGLVAHLVGSVVNGDMAIGLRVTTTLSLFGLMARIGTSFGDRGSYRQMLGLWRVIAAPTSAGSLALLGAVTDPFKNPERHPLPRTTPTPHSSDLTWREWATMPLMGPVLLTGFLTGMVSAFFLAPLIAAAWRQRKYMADATAVQLSRDPDGLAAALVTLSNYPTSLAPWAAHLAVVGDPSSRDGAFGGSIVPIFPAVRRRVAALDRMGAHVTLAPKPPLPWWLVALGGALGLIVFGLLGVVVYLLVIVSAALSGMFTLVPAGILHAILRAVARGR
ncbi:MAG TPA: M48 family metalloprotease, partial [Dehalococcoidia bacterium]|nr:M48 family metalloprotease [Dehalococcoidia bacterium]